MTDSERIAVLESQREVLLNALCRAVEIITGQIPTVERVKREFLENGNLPLFGEPKP